MQFGKFFDPRVTQQAESYTDSQLKPDFEALPNDQRVKKQEQEQLQKKREDLLTNFMMNLTREKGSRGVLGQNVATNQGFHMSNGGPGEEATGRSTFQPLPFDQYYSKTANVMGIINSMEPDLYQANQEVIQNLAQATPEALRIMNYKGGIFEGVPQDFRVNRFNIATQRARENDVYAFI